MFYYGMGFVFGIALSSLINMIWDYREQSSRDAHNELREAENEFYEALKKQR